MTRLWFPSHIGTVSGKLVIYIYIYPRQCREVERGWWNMKLEKAQLLPQPQDCFLWSALEDTAWIDVTEADSWTGNGGIESAKLRRIRSDESFSAAFFEMLLLGCCWGLWEWAKNHQCSLTTCERGESKHHGDPSINLDRKEVWIFMCLFLPRHWTQAWKFSLNLREGITSQRYMVLWLAFHWNEFSVFQGMANSL